MFYLDSDEKLRVHSFRAALEKLIRKRDVNLKFPVINLPRKAHLLQFSEYEQIFIFFKRCNYLFRSQNILLKVAY